MAVQQTKPTDEQKRLFEEWVSERPQAIRQRAIDFPPWNLYELVTTGQHCQLYSYDEGKDGSCDTCTIIAWMPGMPELTTRGVFGISFDDLSAIEPPAEGAL